MNKPIEPRERSKIEEILQAGQRANLGWWHRQDARVAIAALVVAGLLFLLWQLGGSSPGVRYVTEPVARADLVVTVTATGSVQPINKVDVSSELSGTVRKVLVDYNSPVKAGQPLAELDTDKLKATVESSRARLAAAKARVADAKATIVEKRRDLERKKALEAKQVSSAQNLDLAQAAYDRAIAAVASAEADVDVAQAELRLNETNLAKACICSPINGVVLTRNVDPGQTVASSFQAPVLFSIAEDLKQMELRVDIDEADVGKVKPGQTVSFGVDAYPERKFPAVIRDVRYASETIQGVVTYKGVITVDNSDLLLRPGMTATAEIRVTELSDVMLAPNAALRFTPTADGANRDNRSLLRRIMPGPPRFRSASRPDETGRDRVVFVLSNGAAKAVKVVVGPSDGARTHIVSGEIKAGDVLIVDQVALNR